MLNETIQKFIEDNIVQVKHRASMYEIAYNKLNNYELENEVKYSMGQEILKAVKNKIFIEESKQANGILYSTELFVLSKDDLKELIRLIQNEGYDGEYFV